MTASVLDKVRCTILDATYRPIAVTSSRKALLLVFKGKAAISQEHPEHVIHTSRDIWGVPTQIVLNKIIKHRVNRKALLTQRNLFIRDGYTCQYCNRHQSRLKTSEFLTRDHVIARANGGEDTWENVVVACSTCNNKKADMILVNTNLTLHKTPYAPTVNELMERNNKRHKVKL